MLKANVLTLIGEDPKAHGIFDPPTESNRKVYCTVKSIGQTEAYQARGVGLNPELKIILAHDFEYHGEKRCVLDGIRYEILRTYVTETDGIELTVQRATGNARELPEPVITTTATEVEVESGV